MKRAMVAFSLVSFWPDFDAVGFLFGIRYADQLGHRGATHSLVVALAVGFCAFVVAERRGLPARRTTLFATLVAMSHGLLDTMTFGGGLGCALFWPFSAQRFWAPLRFIPVSPIGARILSSHGISVMATEVVIFAPFWIYATFPWKKTPP